MKRNSIRAWVGNLPKALQIQFKTQQGKGLGKRSRLACLTIGVFAALIGDALPADVPFMAVLKGQKFEQFGPTVVALNESDDSDGDQPLVFESFAQGMAADSLVSGSLLIPGGGSVPLVRESVGGSEFQYKYQSDKLLDINTFKPNGAYAFILTTKNDGAESVEVSLAGDAYPNVPLITNYDTLQSATHSAAITVQWAAMTGGTEDDFILVSVSEADTGNNVYESDAPGSPTALNGLSTQAIIPAVTLLPGRSYEAEVLFVKVVDMNDTSYPGAQAVAGYYKEVEFEINTQALTGVALGATFEGSLPTQNGWGVARDSLVAFRFSHPMNPALQSVSWTGVNPSDFAYEWIDGNKVLLCQYNTSLPANTDVGWSLDLTGFRDAANFPLIGTADGTFQTSSDDPESPPDVDGIYVVKGRSFNQAGASPVSDGMFFCEAEVELNAYNRVKAATMTMENSNSTVLERDQWNPGMEMEAEYAAKTDFDRFFSNGDFTFDLTTVDDGVKSVTLSMGASDDYPAAPTVTNLVALQAIDPATPTTITWDALLGWSAAPSAGSGMIELEVENAQGNEVHWADNEDLTSGSQHVIPAGTLSPGRTYRVSLVFTKIKDLDDTTYPGVMGGVGFSSETVFTIQTIGNPVMPDFLAAPSGDGMNLSYTGGEANWCYVLESSRDMQRWSPLTQTGGDNSYFDNDARYLGLRFYRLRDCAAGEIIQMNRMIQGTVWTDQTQSTPVASAIVGTSMDGQTVVTDSKGSFFLETDTPNGSGVYTVSVISGVTQKDFGPFTGDQPRGENYWMNQSQDNVSIGGTVWTDTQNTTRVAGAVVGTSLDGQTTVTDSNGNFFLQTDTPANYSSTPYTITIRVGMNTTNLTHIWGDHPINQNLGLDGSYH